MKPPSILLKLHSLYIIDLRERKASAHRGRREQFWLELLLFMAHQELLPSR